MSYWFKFYGQEFLTDPKMMKLNTEQRLMWIGLLCMASGRDSDTIKFLTEDNLKLLINLDPNYEEWKLADESFKKFIDLEMITMPDKDTIILLNFIKRQESHLTGAERVAKHRAKKEESYECNTTDVTDVTSNRIEEKRKEEKRIDKKDIELTNLLYSFVKQNYPFIINRKTDKQTQGDYEEMNRINRLDGRDYKIIEGVIRWSQQDEFWKQNIRSVSKLREKFDQLLVKISSNVNKNKILSFDK